MAQNHESGCTLLLFRAIGLAIGQELCRIESADPFSFSPEIENFLQTGKHQYSDFGRKSKKNACSFFLGFPCKIQFTILLAFGEAHENRHASRDLCCCAPSDSSKTYMETRRVFHQIAGLKSQNKQLNQGGLCSVAACKRGGMNVARTINKFINFHSHRE
jgi:hypothetical protein